MKKHFKQLLLFAIIASGIRNGYAAQKGNDLANAKKVPFCALALNSDKYDGDVVLTEAVIYTSFHSIVMIDPLCKDLRRQDGEPLSAEPTFDPSNKMNGQLEMEYTKALAEDGRARLIFIGIVESKPRHYGLMSLPFRIKIQKLIAIHRIAPAEREALGIPESMDLLLKKPLAPPPEDK